MCMLPHHLKHILTVSQTARGINRIACKSHFIGFSLVHALLYFIFICHVGL
jgi:hypothetical protein